MLNQADEIRRAGHGMFLIGIHGGRGSFDDRDLEACRFANPVYTRGIFMVLAVPMIRERR